MENKILHFVQNDNLPPPVLASRCCEAISLSFCHPEGTEGSYQQEQQREIMQNKILHCVQNDNLLSIVITSLF